MGRADKLQGGEPGNQLKAAFERGTACVVQEGKEEKPYAWGGEAKELTEVGYGRQAALSLKASG